ncbi:MAG TPA: hypothetical protein VGD22_10570 [Sphingobacteriaceae bacterium]
MGRWKYVILFLLICVGSMVFAQPNTENKTTVSSFLLRQKGIFNKVAKQLLSDTSENNVLLRNDELFQKYSGKIIRDITIQTIDFGVSITDTSKYLKSKLITISNKIHQQTRDKVIRNNLFFSENQKLSPYRMADNEKHLRDLSFLQDAKIIIEPITGSVDSVDVIILTKDILSLGGSLNIHSNESLGITLKEDNFFGSGDHLQVQTFYDLNRDQKMGYGFAYIKRNIRGSFIDLSVGHINFDKTFSSEEKEERVTYLKFEKPLVNRYMQWNYGLEASIHRTQNLYNIDSVYRNNFMYKYHVFDAYAAWNMDADKKDRYNASDRLRRLIGFRFLEQNFYERPTYYTSKFFNRYADITAVLGDVSLFKQNFYKTHFVYGFGRNEDVPEGGGASLTTGYTKINNRERLYAGINFQRYYFTTHDNYFNYTLRSGAYLYKNKLEDINMLASLDYFSRLRLLNNGWKHRIFLGISASRQIKSVFNDPLVLESVYGLPDYKNNNVGGRSRITAKGEAVFFSPLSLLFFKFAPFVFANASVLNIKSPYENNHRVYSALGGGMRIRNESLVFKTIELKGMYFPRKNFYNESWRFEIGTNIRFKYNHEFIKRPEFVSVN